MKVNKTQAFILKKISHAENNSLITFLTHHGEKLTLFAPAAQVSKKRFGTSLDLFNYVDIIYKESYKSHMGNLGQSVLLDGMEWIRKDLKKYAIACFFSELIIEFIPEKNQTPEIYHAFSDLLKNLNNEKPVLTHQVPLLEHHFLALTGFKPVLDVCLQCRSRLDSTKSYFFHGRKGGILCQPCYDLSCQSTYQKSGNGNKDHAKINGSFPMGYDLIQRIIKNQYNGKPENDALWHPKQVNQARHAFEYFIQYTAGKPFKSLRFLSDIMD